MTKFFNDITENGSSLLDLTDYKESVTFFVACYKNGKCVPSTGTASFSVSVLPGQWHSIPSEGDAVINLSTAGSIAAYNPPVFIGGAKEAKVIISGLPPNIIVKSFARSGK